MTFGGVEALNVQVLSSRRITGSISTDTPKGVVDVVVDNNGAVYTIPDAFKML